MIPNRNNNITTQPREQGYDPTGGNVKTMPTDRIDGPYLCLGCGQRKTTGAVAYAMPNALWCPVCWAFAKRSDYVLFPPTAAIRLGEFSEPTPTSGKSLGKKSSRVTSSRTTETASPDQRRRFGGSQQGAKITVSGQRRLKLLGFRA